MKLFFISALFILSACGDTKGKNVCVSQQAKILECRALEAAGHYFNTEAMLEAQKAKCERVYNRPGCYD